ncbi:MAG: hypothetical protein WEE20_05600, partial [Bacteroidota bacterium]
MICATQDNYFRMAMLGLVERCRYPDFPVSVWEHHGIPNDWKGRGESEMRSVGENLHHRVVLCFPPLARGGVPSPLLWWDG